MTLTAGDSQNYTGTVTNLVLPTAERIHLEDIIHSLSLQCRFNGHCKQFYSVAEHSMHVEQWYRYSHSNQIPMVSGSKAKLKFEKECMYALLHDAPETYTGDIITPNKNLYGYSELKLTEMEIMDLIAAKFDLGPKPEGLKAADLSLLLLEYEKLHKPALPGNEWPELKNAEYPWNITIECLWPVEAEAVFSKKVYTGLHKIETLKRACDKLSG